MSVFDKSRVRDRFWEMIAIYYGLQNSCWLLYCAELLQLFSKLKMMNVSFILELSLIAQIQLHRLNDKFINNSIMIAIML